MADIFSCLTLCFSLVLIIYQVIDIQQNSSTASLLAVRAAWYFSIMTLLLHGIRALHQPNIDQFARHGICLALSCINNKHSFRTDLFDVFINRPSVRHTPTNCLGGETCHLSRIFCSVEKNKSGFFKGTSATFVFDDNDIGRTGLLRMLAGSGLAGREWLLCVVVFSVSSGVSHLLLIKCHQLFLQYSVLVGRGRD